MEYRDLILSGNVTTYQVVDEDKECFQSTFDELIDNSMPVAEKWGGIALLKSEQKNRL